MTILFERAKRVENLLELLDFAIMLTSLCPLEEYYMAFLTNPYFFVFVNLSIIGTAAFMNNIE